MVDTCQQDCSICFDPLTGGSRLIGACRPCGHVFHMDCYKQWADVRQHRHVSCPICQQRVADMTRLFLTLNIPTTSTRAATASAAARCATANRDRAEVSKLRNEKRTLLQQLSKLQSRLTERNTDLQLYKVQLSRKMLEIAHAKNHWENENTNLTHNHQRALQQAHLHVYRLEQESQSQLKRMTARLSATENALQGVDIVQEALQILTESQVKIAQWQSSDAQLHVSEVKKRWKGLSAELRFMASQLQTVAWEPDAVASDMAQNIVLSAEALVSICESQVQAAQTRSKAEIQLLKEKFLQHFMRPIVNQPYDPSSNGESQTVDEAEFGPQPDKPTMAASGPLRIVVPPIFASKTLKAPPVKTETE